MLTKFEKEIPDPKLRLMGLRVTHLVSTRKDDVDFFGVKRPPTSTSRSSHADVKTDEDGWQVWPEKEFEEAARQERQDDMDELERLSQERIDHLSLEQQGESETTREEKDAYKDCTFPRHYRESPKSNRSAARYKEPQDDVPAAKEDFWDCPVCERPQAANDKALNEHIDLCLSRQTIKEVVKEAGERDSSSPVPDKPPIFAAKKRGRPRNDAVEHQSKTKMKKPFFA